MASSVTVLSAAAETLERVARPQSAGRRARPNLQEKKEWCGKYCLPTDSYDAEYVGPKAMKHQYLRRNVRGQLAIENTISLPFGCIQELLEGHHENAGPNSQVRRTCTMELSSAEQRSKEWRKCRQALQQIKIPALMLEDTLAALFAEQMVVPTTKQAWEDFRADIAEAAALLFTPTYLDQYVQSMNPLDLPVSLLVRDMQAREYDFVVGIDAKGEVQGDVKLPYSCNRGMTFATSGPGTRPATVRPPCPHLGYTHSTSAVELDGVTLPQAVGRHHAAITWEPPKQTFEGDNMLVVPQYKQEIYNKLVETVKRASDLVPLGSSAFTMTGYITNRMDVVISDVYEEDLGNQESLWSWDSCELSCFV